MCSFAEQGLGQKAVVLDLCSISWTPQTSLEKPVHRSVVKYLETIPEVPSFDPMLVTGCFEDLVGCVSVNGNKMVVMERLEQFATAICLESFVHFPSSLSS